MLENRGRSGYTARVRDRIYDHIFAYPDSEVGGVLVGTKFEGGGQTISGSVIAEFAEGDLTSLTFTHDTWNQIHATIEREHSGKDIVGWYHSHPGHGIFLSTHDAFIHQNFFLDPSCLALVIDPLRGEEGMFGWAEGELTCFWHQATSRDPVAGVAPPPLVDGGSAATPETVSFERVPTYDHEVLDPEVVLRDSELVEPWDEPDQNYRTRLEDPTFYEEPSVTARPTIDSRNFPEFDSPPQMVSRAESSFSAAAYLLPAAGGLLLGALAALVLRFVG